MNQPRHRQPARARQRRRRLPLGLRYAAVAADGGRLVVGGGVTEGGATNQVLVFDPANGTVAPLGRMDEVVGHAAAFTLRGTAYLAGGQDDAGAALRTVYAVDPAQGTIKRVAPLPLPLSDPGVAQAGDEAWLVGGWRGQAVGQVLSARLRVASATSPSAPATSSVQAGAAVVRPFAGLLLVADRGNDRILVMGANKRIVWRYPARGLPAPPFHFSFPDDAFWVHGGHAILVNEEENDVLAEIAYPSGRTLWTYGHPGVAGTGSGHLHQPDDAYPLPGGGLVVADARNCRLLFFDPGGVPVRQIGTNGNPDVPGSCVHELPSRLGYPNGDTPLPDGSLLVSELRGGWIDQVDRYGKVKWAVQVPGIKLPSDPQRLGDGSYLAVDYETPGRVVRFDSTGHVLWQYFVRRGKGELSNPSLAVPLPNGLVAVNDDFNDRVVLIDPATNRVVWQYGRRGAPGTGFDQLDTPDGLDLLLPGGVVPLHVDFPATQTAAVGRP